MSVKSFHNLEQIGIPSLGVISTVNKARHTVEQHWRRCNRVQLDQQKKNMRPEDMTFKFAPVRKVSESGDNALEFSNWILR